MNSENLSSKDNQNQNTPETTNTENLDTASPTAQQTPANENPQGVSRRKVLLASSVAAAAGLAIGAGGTSLFNTYLPQRDSHPDVMALKYPFRGQHQPGIVTPQQQQMFLAAYDLTTERAGSLVKLLQDWSLAAERMMDGDLVAPMRDFKDVPPDDTGETMGLGPGALTITIGFGESLFMKDGKSRFNLGNKMPEGLKGGIPRMSAEKLEESKCYGDLVVQACAEDPMITLHAIHNLTRIAFGTATLKWTQLGYGRTSSTSTKQLTPRNLFGFKDGTSNLKAESGAEVLNQHLWIQPGDSGGEYAAGGSYLCYRKIHQMMEVWDELVLTEQEQTIGRDKIHGAPLSGGEEFTEPDFAKKDAAGALLIPEDSHVAIVHPNNNKGARMLRRGYNYMEGNNYLGRLQGGLVFLAYVRNPQTNFIPVLSRMSGDAMTEYLQHVATGLWLIPPGLKEKDTYVGQAFFE